jgi:hypothetical protein
MFNPRELMHGNLLRDKLTGEWLRVEEVKHVPGENPLIGFEVINRSKFPLPDGWQAEGILLTRDIMERCGFKMEVKNGRTEYTLIIDDSREVVMYAMNPYSLPYIPHMPHVKYLHQVQNLVQIMCNHTLTVKLAA